jgi:type IV secretion system protein VirD4
LAPWKSPLIDYATSASDFDIADFKKQRITLYVGTDPTNIDRLQPVMRFFYQHAADRLMTTAKDLGPVKENGGVCLFMDEFYSVGKLDKFVSCMPYFRGYKIKLFLITSDIERIEKIYGKIDTNSIISDCSTKIAFAARSYETANKISQIFLDQSGNTKSLSWEKIVTLNSDLQIILRDDEKPIISKKLFYYKDEEIKKKIIASASC